MGSPSALLWALCCGRFAVGALLWDLCCFVASIDILYTLTVALGADQAAHR
jgi:hypothetical protein